MIAVFQYLSSCHKEEGAHLFSGAPDSRTRSKGWKLIKERRNLELRRNFLTVRRINQWNNLPPEIVGASSLEPVQRLQGQHFIPVLWTERSCQGVAQQPVNQGEGGEKGGGGGEKEDQKEEEEKEEEKKEEEGEEEEKRRSRRKRRRKKKKKRRGGGGEEY
ncbi:Sodium/potassium/calcium exchanger 1, partial [Ophiophagus hannah]